MCVSDKEHKHSMAQTRQSSVCKSVFYTQLSNVIGNLLCLKSLQEQLKTKLKKWIGSEEYLTLSQFADVLEKIGGSGSLEEATEIFNKLDASKNGKIESSQLLQDEQLQILVVCDSLFICSYHAINWDHTCVILYLEPCTRKSPK